MKRRRKRKQVNWWIGIGISVLITAVMTLLGRTGAMHEMELKSYDQRFLLRGPRDVSGSDAVLVTIDDEDFTSLDMIWPFPRSYYAHAINNLLAAGARMVVIDIQFFESWPDSAEDIALARAVSDHPGKVILSAKISFTDKAQVTTQLTRVILPAKRLYLPGVQVGVVNEIEDRDGFTRQYPFSYQVDQLNWLPLSLKAFQLSQPDPDKVRMEKDTPGAVRFARLKIPRMTENSFLINFAGPTGSFPTFSISSVLDDAEFTLSDGDTDYMQWFIMPDEAFAGLMNLLPEESAREFRAIRGGDPFRDKVVFIGAAASALQDMKETPFFAYSPPGQVASENSKMPGVEVHAHAYQTLVEQSWLRNSAVGVEILITFLLALLVFAINNLLPIGYSAPLTFLLGLGFGGVNYYAFAAGRLWLAFVVPEASLITMFGFTTIYRYLLEQRDKAQIRGMFSQYVPKKVVDQLIENPEMMRLGGERRRMTCLFTDIAGFTSVAERLTPEELVGLLNEYLSEMSRIILANEGIIDKYEGDLIMAEWGAPVYNEHHAASACGTALKMQRRLAELRREFDRRGLPQLESRVGINTGEMIVGNMGCLEVFDYTVMGDAVNLASRLEGANKSYGTSIMIGPETHVDVKDSFATRILDELRVKGRDKPVRVFELIAESWDQVPEVKKQVIDDFERGWKNYRLRRFEDAIAYFKRALERDPGDGPSLAYIERCQLYLATPPPEDWDGVFVLTEK